MPLPDTQASLPDSIQSFIGSIQRAYSPPSVSAYTQALSLFLDHLREGRRLVPATLLVKNVQMEWGESFLEFLQAKRSVETEHLYTRALMHYFRYLAEEFGAAVDTERLAQFFETHRRPKSHAIPEIPLSAVGEILAFAAQFQPLSAQSSASEREHLGSLRDKAFILTLGYTGLRVSEICELRRHQFDSDKSQIVANTNLGLSLPTSAVSALIAYLSARRKLDSQQPSAPGDLPLFARHDKRAGSRILSVSRWTGANIVDMWVRLGLDQTTRVALEKAHMNITPHTFRHYFVFNALASTDKDISSAQRLARHGDRSTTRRYLQQMARSTADETST